MRVRKRKAYLRDYHKKNYNPVMRYGLEEKGQWVYVILNDMTNMYKIGISLNPLRRISNISAQSGMEMMYVMMYKPFKGVDPSAKFIEAFLHEKNKRTRFKRTEWFSLTNDDLISIHNFFYDMEGENFIVNEDFKTLFNKNRYNY